jgi:drug/metabolite transporter superfamily protein YnfA
MSSSDAPSFSIEDDVQQQHEEVVGDTVGGDDNNSSDGNFQWTTATIIQSVALFFLAGAAEIVGGWMVWMAVRGNDKKGKQKWWFALLGSAILVLYGFVPTFQPTSNFGRIYAAYGGAFIVLSFLFGWAADGNKPDTGDVVGGTIALVGAGVIYFWPRN